ncbi:MAG: hypothetical protein LUP97_03760 [Methanoregula sp.]|nr:hypothetical protein [Methanoregula sp.]
MFDENFWLLVLIAILLLAGDVLMALAFPLNLPAPVFRAFGSVFCIAFLHQVILWIDRVASTDLYTLFRVLSFMIVPLVFILVLAAGYLAILRQIRWRPKERPRRSRDCRAGT